MFDKEKQNIFFKTNKISKKPSWRQQKLNDSGLSLDANTDNESYSNDEQSLSSWFSPIYR